MDFDGAHVLILGLAREGVSLARFLAERGSDVTVTDAAPQERLRERLAALSSLPIRAVVGGHYPELVAGADRFFVSPGVPESNPVYQAAVEREIEIESMTTLFFELCPGRIVGITGSAGKTTTTGLIGQILRRAGYDAAVGGNIGDPMLDLLPVIGPETTVVLELSSFQLGILRRSPQVAVITNITPNHLDRHGSMESYVEAKRHIVSHQHPGDVAVLNGNDPTAGGFAAATPATIRWFGERSTDGATTSGEHVGLVRDGRFMPVMSISDMPIRGRHNVENVLAAIATADVLAVSPQDMAEGIRTYRPAAHRLQVVGERGGVQYIDDSIATTPVRAMVALEAIDAPVLLIAGGRDKKLPWESFARLVVEKVRSLFLIGEAAPSIEGVVKDAMQDTQGALSRDAVYRCTSLEEAVRGASRCARPGDVVLLSPGCTSYDMFTDFAERGQAFARAVERLDAG